MKKKNYLAYRVAASFGLLCFLLLLSIASVVAVGYRIGQLSESVVCASVLLALSVAAIVVIALMVERPYREVVRVQKLFLNEQIYDDLFQLGAHISPENQQMMERFRLLLSKQDMVSLSKRQAEYLALQNQINPHFLYNTLEAIRGDALDAGQTDIAKTAEALATYFRYTITETDDLVTVEDELDNVDSYFTIQRYRFGDKLSIRVLADDEMVYRCRLPRLTLQPIVENAIFHGLESKVGNGEIAIQLQLTQTRLLISVKDNGVGIAPESLQRINLKLEKVKVSFIGDEKGTRGGIALRNVAQRIKLLFGEEYGLQLYSTPDVGTEVRIHLPKIV